MHHAWHWELWQWVVYGGASLAASIFSGIAGAGGGFIMTPLLILLGLTPAQAVSTGKFNGLAITVGSLSGMGGDRSRVSWRRVIPVMVLALVVGLIVPYVIKGLESQAYRIILGCILLAMIPLVIVKKIGLQPHRPTPAQRVGGGVLLAVALFLQGTFSGGLGTLVNVVLMGMLGMTATEANITKRWSQLILNVVTVLGVLSAGLIVWPVLLLAVPTVLVGGYIGGRLAVKKGDKFVMDVMVGLMVISGLALILGA